MVTRKNDNADEPMRVWLCVPLEPQGKPSHRYLKAQSVVWVGWNASIDHWTETFLSFFCMDFSISFLSYCNWIETRTGWVVWNLNCYFAWISICGDGISISLRSPATANLDLCHGRKRIAIFLQENIYFGNHFLSLCTNCCVVLLVLYLSLHIYFISESEDCFLILWMERSGYFLRSVSHGSSFTS